MAKVIYKFGDDISTDIIYPGRYMATILPSETPRHIFGDIPSLNKQLVDGEIEEGSIVVAGKNFGCGSSREQAATTIKGHELVIVARNFARIFMQNAINLGLKIVICPGIEAEDGDELEIYDDKVINKISAKEYPVTPIPEARKAIMEAGGLIPYTRKKLIEERSDV